MSNLNQPPSTEPQSSIDFKLKYASIMTTWGVLENVLAATFEKLTQMHPLVSRAVFYSARSFNGRMDMVNAVFQHVNYTHDYEKKLLKGLLNKTERYSSARNILAHGDILTIGTDGSPYQGQTILLDGSQIWTLHPDKEKVLTFKQLHLIHRNFTLLYAIFSHFQNGYFAGKKQLIEQALEIVQRLPTPAHSSAPSQNASNFLSKLPPNLPLFR